MAKQKTSEVTLDRRASEDRRSSSTERREATAPVVVERRVSERRKVPRRRQIDPTTCERDYTLEEIEFMHALDAYKRANGRMFPTCSEILEVVRSLGYARVAPATEAAPVPEADQTASHSEVDQTTDSEIAPDTAL